MIRRDPEVFFQSRFECFFIVDFQQLLQFPFKLTLSKARPAWPLLGRKESNVFMTGK